MKRETKLLLVTVALITILSIGGGLFGHTVHAAPTLSTDKPDYSPGQTVYINGTGWTPGATVTVSVTRPGGSVQTCTSPSPGTYGFQAPCTAADSLGNFAAPPYKLNGIVGTYTIDASDGTGNVATMTFTDALGVDFTQCENDHNHNGVEDIPLCTWTTGNLDAQHDLLAEGNTLPNVAPSAGAPTGQYTANSNVPGWSNQRIIIQTVPDGSYRLRIGYEFTKAGVKAYDFLTTNYGVTDSNLCDQLPSGTSSGTCSSLVSSGPSTFTFPTDATAIAGKVGSIADRQTAHSTAMSASDPASQLRKMKVYGLGGSGSITSISNVGISGSALGDSDYFIDVFFTKSTGSSSDVIATFGAHFAIGSLFPVGWGSGNGAGSISGSPFHVTFQGLFDSTGTSVGGGSRDNQVSVSTVLGVTVSCSPSKGTTSKPISCTATGSGGSSPYTFTWSAPGGSPSSGTGSTFSTTYSLPGTYTVTVTITDKNGVSTSSAVMFVINTQPKTLALVCGSGTAGKPVSCTATSSGPATSYPPISYSWSAPGCTPSSGTGSGTSFTWSVTCSAKGTYTVTVIQTDSDTFSTTASTSLVITAQPLMVSVSCPSSGVTVGKPFNCTVSASGGTGPYSGTGTFARTEPSKGTKTESFSVTDANHVSASGSASVVVGGQPLIVTVTCPTSGLTAGKPFNCDVSATGGTTPYSGTGTFSRTEATKGPRTESFTVTDANSVSASGSASVSIGQQPLAVSVTCPSGITAGKPFNCTVSATGGTTPYTGTGIVSRTEPVKGTFAESFVVGDANGKSASASVMVTVVQQPFTASVSCGTGQTAGKPFTCIVSATGGTQPYTGTGSFSVTQPVKGTFTESFNVKESNGKTAVASTQVTVVQQPFTVSVTCGNASGGAVTAGKAFTCTVSASGGTGPYLGTGTFMVTQPVKGDFTESFNVKDANGKTAIASTSVHVDQQPFVVSVDCGTGQTAGKPFSCTVSATGGTQPYGGTGTFSVTQPVKGDFLESFNVNDANGKTAVASTSVHVEQQPFTVSVSCGTGQTAGKPFTCIVSANGGTQPYSGTGPFSVTQPVKGSFTERFNVKDANGKTAVASTQVTVTQQPFTVSVTCGNASGGAITAGKAFSCTVSATGGTQPYNGTGTFTLTEAVKGSFPESFTVTDANGKSAVASTTVTVVQQPFVVSVSCGASGAITAGKAFSCTVSATGGTQPYSGTGTFIVTQPVKGTFTESFNVKDANGKTAVASTQVTVVQQPFTVSVTCGPSVPTGQVTAGKPFTCSVSASGGTAPYQGTGDFTVTEPVKGTFHESFDVTDANGKTEVATTTVTVVQQPFVVSASCGPSTPSGQITAGKPFSCTVSATGGTAPYQGTGTFTVTEPVKGHFTESFNVKDANGKTATASTQVTVTPQPLVVTVTCPSGLTAGKVFTCTYSATGGTAPYASTGTSFVSPTKGTYTVPIFVTDSNGVTTLGTQTVTVAQQPFVVTATCDSGATAGKPFTCTVSATGGTTPYTGTGAFVITEPVKGTFHESFDVKDANGKTAVATTTVTVVQQPFTVSVTCGPSIPTGQVTSGKPFTCTVSASGGTEPYQGTGDFVVTEPVKGTFTESFNVKDANGKSAVASTQVTVVQQPFVVSVTCVGSTPTHQVTAGKPFSCTVSATGGTEPYRGTGTFTVTEPVKGTFHESFDVKDANGKTAVATTTVTVVQQPFIVTVSCGPSTPTGQITAGKPFSCTVSASGGTAPYQGTGIFTLTEPVKGTFTESFDVKDANGKTAVATTTVNVVQQPFVVSVTCGPSVPTGQITAGKPFTCYVSATGGTAPYHGIGNFVVTEPFKGSFVERFVVSDSNGKGAIASVQVTVVQQPFVVSVTCGAASGGQITAGKPFSCTVSATGGTTPYRGTGIFTVTEPVKGTFHESFDVKDANGKIAIATTTVTVVQQPFVVSVTCGSSIPTGQITAGKPFTCNVSATGGTEPYQGTGDFVVTEPVKGTFHEFFDVQDANGKTAVATTTVDVIQQPFIVSVSCGPSTPIGQITAGKPFTCSVSATGGTAPYQGTGDFVVTEPVKGSFHESFDVKDANGKTAVATTTVTVVQQPFVVTVSCGPSIPTGQITAGKPFTCDVSATGGTEPYQGTGAFTVIEPVKGTFIERFNVKDANGKTAIASVQVTVVQQPFVVSVTCGPSIATGQVTAGKPFTCSVSATGGTAPYHGVGDFVVVEPVKGTFHESFNVKDANGKTAVATTTVDVVQQPFVVSVTCGPSTPIGQITAGKPFSCHVSATGGTEPYQGVGDFVIVEPVKGTFVERFLVGDSNGKTAVASVQVTVVQQPFVVSVSCGSASSAITAGKPFTCSVSATGGTEPYLGTGDFTLIEPVKGSFTESFTVNDANGKTAIASTHVTVIQQPFVASVTCRPTAVPYQITAGKPFTCVVSATGGTEPYQGTGAFQIIEPVKGGHIEVFTVRDANGKTVDAITTVVVVQQPFIVSVSCGTAANVITAGKPFTCAVSATGGTQPYLGTGDFTVTEPVKGDFSESFTVTDANGKFAIASTQVHVVQQPFVVSVSCGSASAAITAGKPFSCTVSATGGTEPYQGTGDFTITEPVKGTFTESFNVKDANGKTAIASVMVHVVQQPFVVSVTCGSASAAITAGKPFSCTVSATGGTQPYHGAGTFQLTEPVKGYFTESFTVTDANGKSAVASTQVHVVQQPFVVGVSCGTAGIPITAGKPFTCTVSATGGTQPYEGTGDFTVTQPVKGDFTESFTVTDANGKSAIASVTVHVVQQPFIVSVSCGSVGVPITAGKPFQCTVSATGGTQPYHGTGIFTVTEPVKGSFTESFNVNDANGKTAVASTQVSVSQQPFVVSVTCGSAGTPVTAGKPFTCTVSATGGTGPYQGTGDFTVTEPVKGTFRESFNVKDANGKTAVASTSVHVVQQPFVVSVSCGSSSSQITAGKPFSCMVSATGGTQPYQGTGTFTVTQPVKGTFTEYFNVTDANGKSAVASMTVHVIQQPFVVSVNCGSAGQITAGKPFICVVSATGGTAPYQGVGNFTVTQPVKGTFTESFNVKDANGKTAVASTTVTVVQQPFVGSVICTGPFTAGKPFTCTVSATGGTSPYSGTGTFTLTQPVKGTFTESFTVGDANGKSVVASTMVTVLPQPLSANFSSVCSGSATVFTATVSGGTSPYSFSWSFGDSTTGTGNPVSHSYGSSSTFTVTLTVTDANGARTTVTHTASGCGQPVVVTDTMFCKLPSNNFVLIFITDPQNPSSYRLVASNPGQFYDNVFYSAAPGSPVTLNIQVPYPFVTNGAYPIQISSSFSLTSAGCFVPSFDNPSGFTITAPGPLSPSGHPTIVLSNYSPQNFGSTVTVTVTGTVPASGLVYVTIHLDYGLKGTSGWLKGVAQGSSFQATNSGLGLALNNGQSYAFSVSGSESFTTSVTSSNVFKKDPGIAGVVTSAVNGNPIAGATVKVYDNNGMLLGITTTDSNGVYLYFYKYTGTKNVNFTIKIITPSGATQTTLVAMQSNKLVEQDFTF